jgi:hypothetical protein
MNNENGMLTYVTTSDTNVNIHNKKFYEKWFKRTGLVRMVSAVVVNKTGFTPHM